MAQPPSSHTGTSRAAKQLQLPQDAYNDASQEKKQIPYIQIF